MSDTTAKSTRPIWYNLSPNNLPVPGLVSIFHRISGLGLFVGLFWLLYLFDLSLSSPESYAQFKSMIGHPLVKVIMLGFLWAFLHHFCAGIRYLLLDLHFGSSLESARKSSFVVFALSLILTAVLGVRLW